MYYEIQSIESLEASPHTRSIVWFWANRAAYEPDHDTPLFEEEFISDLRDSETHIVTDARGWYKLVDGTFIDSETTDSGTVYEFERVTTVTDPSVRLLDNIESFIEQRKADILAGSLGRSRVNHATRVRPVAERTVIASDTRVRAVVGVPREARVREVQP